MRAGFIYSRLTAENKMLFEAAERRGIEIERINDGQFSFELHSQPEEYDFVLNRSLSFSRGFYLSHYFEQSNRVINSSETTRICGDKLLTSLRLVENEIDTPPTRVAFTKGSALNAVDGAEYPLVIKPVMGSWARMVSRINDRDAAEGILEARETLGSFYDKIYYLQNYIEKPNGDIRALVVGNNVPAAIRRISDNHWVTNTHLGGRADAYPMTPELEEVCLKAAESVGSGILGVDLMETDAGYSVNEINPTTEFRNIARVNEVDLGEIIVDYCMEVSRR